MSKKVRVFSAQQKLSAVKRILAGEEVREVAHELKVNRLLLYKWRDRYRKLGAEGFSRPRGRPKAGAGPGSAGLSELAAARKRVAELERKIGQQQVELDFFQRALRQVEADRRASGATGAKAPTPSFKR